ncbi:hypothetical protein DSL72_008336 [Monilinia vaccinii-corymbosi]|uniref:Uncharacterized protein n=1 Tax=Monilinia vaccinii-corymbosi TaxID=61207 RepID=A0A8A3PKQ0_9HELO|nr:hypothetical protein DSL72_008336 [Monilinia vaccinii-corymbosi]
MSTLNSNSSDKSQMAIKRENSEENNGDSYSRSHQSAFHAMGPGRRVDHCRHPDLPVFSPNSSTARGNPTYHPSGFQSGETASLEHQSTSHSSGDQTWAMASPDYKLGSASPEYQRQQGLSSEYQPISPAEYHGHKESSIQQAQQGKEAKINSEFLGVMTNNALKNTVRNAIVSSKKRKSGDGDVLPSAKRLARYHSTPSPSPSQPPESPGFMTLGISHIPNLVAEIERRSAARASRTSRSVAAFMARQRRKLAQPEKVVQVEEDNERQTPSHSENYYNHDGGWYKQTPEPRMPVSAVVEDSQTQSPWASSEHTHITQGHVESASMDISPNKPLSDFSPMLADNRSHEIPRPVKTEERMSGNSSPPIPRAASRVSEEGVESVTLAAYSGENSTGEIAELKEGMKQMRAVMNNMSRENERMMRRAARGGVKVDELSEEVAGLHEQVVVLRNEATGLKNEAAAREKVIASLKDEVTDLKRQASDSTNAITGWKGEIQELRTQASKNQREITVLQTQASDYKADVASLKGEVTRMNHEMIRLERDALRKEVEGLRRRFL